MRTLKKTLCLVLALAMVMSLGVSAFAASAKDDYSDYTSITAKHKEAVDVMTAAGVFNGMGDSASSFAPTGTLTREQAAKIVTYMLMEKADADTLTAIVAPYSDVPATRWSAGAIAYCTNEGILAGVGGGRFDPEGTLTGLQFAKMLVCALGYDAKEEGLEGDTWAVNTAKLLINAGLNGSLETVALTGSITREQAAQMAFNTFKADTVDYPTRIGVNVGDIIVSISGKAAARTTTVPGKGDSYIDEASGTDIIQFVEEYQPKMRYDGAATDDFGRPGHTWYFAGKEVGTYINTPAVVITTTVTEAAVKTALSGYTFRVGGNDYKPGATYSGQQITPDGNYVTTDKDGETTVDTLSTGASETPAKTISRLMDTNKNGYSLEFYANGNNQITKIVGVAYNVTKVSSIVTNGAGDKTYNLKGVSPSPVDYADADSIDTVALEGAVAKDDVVTYAVANSTTYIYPTTTVVGTQSEHNGSKKTITVDDTVYNVGTGVYSYLIGAAGYVDVTSTDNDAQFPNSDKDANYYLDQFGIAVYTEAIASETQYAAIDAIAKSGHLSNEVEAILAFADGTTKTVGVSKFVKEDGTPATFIGNTDIDDVYDEAPNNAYIGVVCTYVVDDDGNYELTAVRTDATAGELTSEAVTTYDTDTTVTEKGTPNVQAASEIITDAKTVFVVKTDDNGKASFKAYTGYASIPTIKADSSNEVTIDYAVGKDGNVAFVYIDASKSTLVTADAEAGDMVFIKNTRYTTSGFGSTLIYYYEAIINGEDGLLATKVKVAANATPSDLELEAQTLYKVTAANDDGVATRLIQQRVGNGTGGDDYREATPGSVYENPHNTVITINNVEYTFDPDTVQVCIIDKDGNIIGDDIYLIDLENNFDEYAKFYIKFKEDDVTKNKISVLYVVKQDPNAD